MCELIRQFNGAMHRGIYLLLIVLAVTCPWRSRADLNQPFALRGYYVTFMRMPTFGLAEWKQMIDCMHDDGANTLILWTAGGFRSKRFPITWKYNAEHKNVEQDYVRDLIDYAHTRQVQVLLGFTPFAYDGVNQYPLEHPELKATQKDGKPANFWGLHSWGYNLCPAQPASQKFMKDYVREMFFEFYPDADGLMIESSDYAICYCAQCREKFFDYEFSFVRQISEEVWRVKTNATVMVYPQYFNGREVPGFEVKGARQKFDARWTLFFTPHSAHIDPDLMKQAKSGVFSDEGISLGTPAKLRESARLARKHGLSGYIASCEPFSCIDGPPGSSKARQKPFHFEWLRDGEMPLNELPARVNRIAYREYTGNPDLPENDFKARLGRELFGEQSSEQNIADVLYLQDCWFKEAAWFSPALLLKPKELKERAEKEKWPASRMKSYNDRVARLRVLENRYRGSSIAAEREMARIASVITHKWN